MCTHTPMYGIHVQTFLSLFFQIKLMEPVLKLITHILISFSILIYAPLIYILMQIMHGSANNQICQLKF